MLIEYDANGHCPDVNGLLLVPISILHFREIVLFVTMIFLHCIRPVASQL